MHHRRVDSPPVVHFVLTNKKSCIKSKQAYQSFMHCLESDVQALNGSSVPTHWRRNIQIHNRKQKQTTNRGFVEGCSGRKNGGQRKGKKGSVVIHLMCVYIFAGEGMVRVIGLNGGLVMDRGRDLPSAPRSASWAVSASAALAPSDSSAS